MSLFSNIDSQLGQPKNIKVGQLIAFKVTGTMTGYVNGAALTISAPPAGGIQATANIVVVAGAITGVTIVNPGAGYLTAPTATAPTGTGAVIVVSKAAALLNKTTNDQIVFVSRDESLISTNRLKGIRIPGWNKVIQKTNSDGSVTYKTECIVAMNTPDAVSGDNRGDDLVVGNVVETITLQPANISVTAPASAAFTVAATGAASFQWQVQTGGVGAYVNLVAAGVYAGGVTAATLNITNSTGLNKNRYRAQCVAAAGAAQVTSRGALLTVA
jgi:hypothetical protein